MTTGAFERLIREAAAGERAPSCDLCALPLDDPHRHLLDTRPDEGAENGGVPGGDLLCACRACGLLFAPDGVEQGRYLAVPDRRIRLDPVPTDRLGVPVGLAFFVPAPNGTVSAHYPSPAGVGRWEVDSGAWRELAAERTELSEVAPLVQALTVNTVRGREQHWVLPLDDCFRLVALVRREWHGLSGGSRVWTAVDDFFANLTERR
jgi:hypothetical protein